MTVIEIAEICHEANKVYCEQHGDHSQPMWDDAPDWQKASAIMGVQHAIDNPNAKPEDSHNSWLKQKTEDGWKYGPVKDPVKKEHPCFVPYEELPEFQKTKDKLFLAIANALKG